MTLIRRMNHVNKPEFLLIQNDTILGVSPTYRNLPYTRLDHTQNWMVVIGTISKAGKPKIIGTVAEAYPKPGKFCLRVSSPLDGEGRLVGNSMTLVGFITQRLGVLSQNGCYNDMAALPPTIVAIGCDSGAPEGKASPKKLGRLRRH